MNDELKSTVRRLLALAGEWNTARENYLKDFPGIGRCHYINEEIADLIARDRAVVADAYLAEHLADDDDPIDAGAMRQCPPWWHLGCDSLGFWAEPCSVAPRAR